MDRFDVHARDISKSVKTEAVFPPNFVTGRNRANMGMYYLPLQPSRRHQPMNTVVAKENLFLLPLKPATPVSLVAVRTRGRSVYSRAFSFYFLHIL